MPPKSPRKRARTESPARKDEPPRGRTQDRPQFIRAQSPSKNVRWGRGAKLIQGPSPSKSAFHERSMSPSKSALHSHCEQRDQFTKDTSREPPLRLSEDVKRSAKRKRSCTPDAQLLGELDNSIHEENPSPLPKQQNPPAFTRPVEILFEDAYGDEIDQIICEWTVKLHDAVQEAIDRFPPLRHLQLGHDLSEDLDPLFSSENTQLQNYVLLLAGCINAKEAKLRGLLRDAESKKALITSIIARALIEEVFDNETFGLWKENKQEHGCILLMGKLESDKIQKLSKARDIIRGRTLPVEYFSYHGPEGQRSQRYEPGVEGPLWEKLTLAKAKVTLQLEAILEPFWATIDSRAIVKIRPLLAKIVSCAYDLRIAIETGKHASYRWSPTSDGEVFDPKFMECYNLSTTIDQSPYIKYTIKGVSRTFLSHKSEQRRDPVVQIVCFPGLTSYKKGGGVQAKEVLKRERQAGGKLKQQALPFTGDEGYTTRVISKSVVQLEWGRARSKSKNKDKADKFSARGENRDSLDIDLDWEMLEQDYTPRRRSWLDILRGRPVEPPEPQGIDKELKSRIWGTIDCD